MPRKRRSRTQRGEGPAWDWIKKAARDVHNFVKDKKLISRGLSSLAESGITPYSSGLSKASTVASTLGYGKRRTGKRRTGKSKTRKTQKGGKRRVGRPRKSRRTMK